MKFGCFHLAILLVAVTAPAADKAPAGAANPIPWNQIGAKAGADYKGDGLTVTPTDSGARLHCVFQRLDGEATPEGLWLTSTAANTTPGRFRVTAMAIERTADFGVRRQSSAATPLLGALPTTGKVSISAQTVRFTRPGLTEEYTVSMDGLRQDFIVEQPPLDCADTSALWNDTTCRVQESGEMPPQSKDHRDNRKSTSPSETIAPNELIVQLSVTGATVEPTPDGATLILENSGRRITYNRLRVTDATGKELPARIEVSCDSALPVRHSFSEGGRAPHSAFTMSILINDTDALYPLRIDPTFSDANWISMGDSSSVNNQVNASVIDNQGNLYIGGVFTTVGHVAANYVAMWNGTNWTPLGPGISGGGSSVTMAGVYSLALSGNTLYAGGSFSSAGGSNINNIAQWNGTNWSAIGSGVSGGLAPNQPAIVRALVFSGGNLYVGGSFTNAGGIMASNIAQWNGSTWSALGSGTTGFTFVNEFTLVSGVFALAVSGNTLYAGGDFTNAGGISANAIAQWDGNSWSALGSGITGGTLNGVGPEVLALSVSSDTLYVGGGFANAGGNPAASIAQWNGSGWSPLGSGINYVVSALALSGSNLYVGGDFSTAGSIAITNVAQWNGTNWSAVGSGVGLYAVQTLALSGNTLYAGGSFSNAAGILTSNLAQWNGTNWSGVGPSIGEYVNAFAVSGSNVYAGGVCPTGAGKGANYVAQWTGSGWIQQGPSFNGAVQALAISGNILYAGGQFTTEGGVGSNFQYVAQWNGTSWTRVGLGGISSSVNTLLEAGGTLYAGGNTFVSQWNGTNWSSLSRGLQGPVNALQFSGNTLYAGGQYYTGNNLGYIPGYVSQWNGTNWSQLGQAGPDFFGDVYALTSSANILYVGGGFTGVISSGSSVSASGVAQWNGSAWLPVGSGIEGTVNALVLSGNTLYAGGAFTYTPNGVIASNIAQWNGTNWSPMGSGLNSQVNALAISGNTLFVGGEFTTAGTNYSYYTAQAILPISVSILTTDGNFGITNGYFGFNISGPPGSNVIIQASTDLQNWTPLQTNILNPSGFVYFSDTQSLAGSKRFYNVVLLP